MGTAVAWLTATMEKERVRNLLVKIYGPQIGESTFHELISILNSYAGRIPPRHAHGLSQRDVMLITYPDQILEPGRPSLASLAEFCVQYLPGVVNGIHILPFYPWSSDDGFSVVQYDAVALAYGQWKDILDLADRFRLMFDAVINHASAESPWFKLFLRDDPEYRNYFVEISGTPDLSAVVRPRALPLIASFSTPRGKRRLWTTFSPDQVDLEYHNPKVLTDVLKLLLFYASQGAQFIRLDAIAYLWKEAGTPCINLLQTHWIVQLMRAVLDEAAPHVMLVTETNVPHLENLSYFGSGTNEAQMVYNFPLPPLVLHALQTGDAGILAGWASELELPPGGGTFLNFLASHDGIGLNPVRGILPEAEIQELARQTEARGGLVSMKANANGTESPYELNINYFDALGDGQPADGLEVQVDRFILAHAILLAFQGMPAIYFHSLFGSRGWPAGVQQTQRSRSINREKLARGKLESELADPSSLRSLVFSRLSALLKTRAESTCFSPDISQQTLPAPGRLFAILRGPTSDGKATLCIHNVSGFTERARVNLGSTPLAATDSLRDLITGREMAAGNVLELELAPYGFMWLSN
jgi:glucosylglycerate phosphorylase